MSSTTTTTTTTTSTTTLKSKKVEKLWKAKWPNNPESVTNIEFETLLIEVLSKENNDEKEESEREYTKTAESLRLFSKQLTEVVFWPDCEFGSDKPFPEKVDKSCIQFAINTFGLWSGMFETIHLNLEKESPCPLQYFHGRTSLENIKLKLQNIGDYLLRYNIEKDSKGLILSWVKAGRTKLIVIKHEKVTRFKAKGKPVVWRWEEKVAGVGYNRIEKHDYQSLHLMLDVFKKNDKCVNPIMFNSAYACYGTGNNANGTKLSGSSNSELNSEVSHVLKKMNIEN